MGFRKRGDEESSVQEDSCGKTILAYWSASLCQWEIEIERELESHDTEREKDDELHRARVHMQFVCRMNKWQHEEGRYFLHEHRQSELPWRKDCVEEIQEMTGAELISVSRGNCNLSSIEKPAVMVTNCPAIAFTSAQMEQTSQVLSSHCGREESPCEFQRFGESVFLKNQTMICSIKHGMITLESL